MPTDLLGHGYETFPVPEPLQQHSPARVIAICSQKGGVDKIIGSVNIAGASAQCDCRALIIDFDPQSVVTVGLGVNADTVGNTTYTTLFDISVDPHGMMQHTTSENIDAIPTSIDLSAVKVQPVTEVDREQILNSVLCKLRSEYDLIIIDCQPSLGLLTVSALATADGVITPAAAEFFASRNMAPLMQSIEKVQSRVNPVLEVDGMLITMYTKTLHCEEIYQRVYEAFSEKMFHTFISHSIKLPNSTITITPVVVYAPEYKTSKEYREVVHELTAYGIVAQRLFRQTMNETFLSRPPSLRETGSRSEAEGSSAKAKISMGGSITPDSRIDPGIYPGPFGTLPGMITSNRLEPIEVSPSSITKEFLVYMRGLDFIKNMDKTSTFLDIASILVGTENVAILSSGEDSQHDEQSFGVLRERNLLLARLFRYRVYKQAIGDFRMHITTNSGRFPHLVAIDEGITTVLSELVWTSAPFELIRLTAQVITNAPAPGASVHQLHVPLVDLWARSLVICDRLTAALESKDDQSMSFNGLAQDYASRIEVVTRSTVVLVLFRQGVLQYQQGSPFTELYLRWVFGVTETMSDVNISEDDFA